MRGLILGTFGLSLIVHAGLLALLLENPIEAAKAKAGPTITLSLVTPPVAEKPAEPKSVDPLAGKHEPGATPPAKAAPLAPPPPMAIVKPDAPHAAAPPSDPADRPKPLAAPSPEPAKPDAAPLASKRQQTETRDVQSPASEAPPKPVEQPAAEFKTAIVAQPALPELPKSDDPVPPPAATQPSKAATTGVEILPPTTPPEPVSRQKIERAIKDYDGGGCFFAAPIRADRRVVGVDGFGESETTLKTFDQSLAAGFGFAPEVAGQHIWSPQCSVVDFLRKIRRDDSNPPVLTLDRYALHSGELLGGTISNVTEPIVGLYWISETGAVQDLSSFLHDLGRTKAFRLNIAYEGNTGTYPQMLLVVTSNRPIFTTIQSVAITADAFFPELSERAVSRRQKLKATAKLFQLSR